MGRHRPPQLRPAPGGGELRCAFCAAPSGSRLRITRRHVWIAIALASLGWGSGGPATRGAFQEGVGPYALVLFRTGLAAVAVAAYLLIRSGRLPRGRGIWRMGARMAVINLVGPFVLFTLAYSYASAGFVGLIAAVIPLGTTLLAHFMLPDEPLYPAKVGGLLVAFVGVAVLGFSGDSGLEAGGRPGLALVLGLAAVVLISLASIYAKRVATTYDPIELTGAQFSIGAVLAIVVALVAEGPPSSITGTGWLLLTYLALASTFLPFAAYYWVLRHTTATHASVIGYLVPIVAVTGGLAFLSEQLQPGIVIGGTLILIGVILTDRLERRPSPLRTG